MNELGKKIVTEITKTMLGNLCGQELKIDTHDGVSHTDEIGGAVILELTLKKLGKTLSIKRSRNEKDFVGMEIVFDVSGKIAIEGHTIFVDHHAKNGKEVFCYSDGIPMASCGIMWEACKEILLPGEKAAQDDITMRILKPIDMLDNGISIGGEASTLSNFISDCNPQWNESFSSDEGFENGKKLFKEIFERALAKKVAIIEARTKITEAIEKQENKKILVLEKAVPWQENLFSLPEEKTKEILYVVFPDIKNGWRLQCVPTSFKEMFTQRKPLPSNWVDSKGKDMPTWDFIFCHKGLFIAGAKSKEGALAMAEIAIAR